MIRTGVVLVLATLLLLFCSHLRPADAAPAAVDDATGRADARAAATDAQEGRRGRRRGLLRGRPGVPGVVLRSDGLIVVPRLLVPSSSSRATTNSIAQQQQRQRPPSPPPREQTRRRENTTQREKRDALVAWREHRRNCKNGNTDSDCDTLTREDFLPGEDTATTTTSTTTSTTTTATTTTTTKRTTTTTTTDATQPAETVTRATTTTASTQQASAQTGTTDQNDGDEEDSSSVKNPIVQTSPIAVTETITCVGTTYAAGHHHAIISVDVPPETRNGDLLLLWVGGSASGNAVPDGPAPSRGWTMILDRGPPDINLKAYRKEYYRSNDDDGGMGEARRYTIEGGKNQYAVLSAYRGLDNDNPVEAFDTLKNESGGQNGEARAPRIQTADGGIMAIAVVHDDPHRSVVDDDEHGFRVVTSFISGGDGFCAAVGPARKGGGKYGPVTFGGGADKSGGGNEVTASISLVPA